MGLKLAGTGDTLCAPSAPIEYEPIDAALDAALGGEGLCFTDQTFDLTDLCRCRCASLLLAGDPFVGREEGTHSSESTIVGTLRAGARYFVL